MATNFPLSFSRLRGFSEENLKKLHDELRVKNYDEHSGIGFRDIYCNQQYLTARIIKREPTFILQYDPISNEITNREIFIFSDFKFGVDVEYELIELYGPAKNYSKLMSALLPFFPSKVRIEAVNIAPCIILPKLIQKSVLLGVEKLVINDFEYQEGIIGRYDMRITQVDLAQEFIKKYAFQVTNAQVLIEVKDFGSVKLSLSSNGHASVKCSEEDLPVVLDFLKPFLFSVNLPLGGEYA